MKYRSSYMIIPAVLTFASCTHWLKEESPMLNTPEDFFVTEEAAVQAVNATYAPLMWEYNNTYYPEWFIGDVASDDALKGGQNISDMADVYDIENFKTISNNGLITDYYRAQYQGIARANFAIEQIERMDGIDTGLQNRLVGEAKFLRAMYYFRLVRLYKSVPLITAPIYSSDGWIQPQSSLDDVFAQIVKDFGDAEKFLLKKSGYEEDDMGRATSGAAQAMLLKSYLYWGNYKENGQAFTTTDCYAEAKAWGDKFMNEQSAEYSLCPVYSDNFTLEGENGPESVFEIQYMADPTSDYGEGNGFTRGTFTTILTRSRSTLVDNPGWGFNKPTNNLVAEFESGDPRLAASIKTPSKGEISNEEEEIYLGCSNLAVKRTLMIKGGYTALSHDTRSPINNVIMRLADIYLLYAEACLKCNDSATAKEYLEKIRSRARGTNSILPEFPGYSVPDYRIGYALHKLEDTPADLEMALRHERRVELAMEGHRWFDICRWGIAKQIMDAYKASETEEARGHMSTFVEGKHEWFPIPHEEVLLSKLTQNNGY